MNDQNILILLLRNFYIFISFNIHTKNFISFEDNNTNYWYIFLIYNNVCQKFK